MRTDRICSLKSARGGIKDGQWNVRNINNVLEDIADDLKAAVESDNLNINSSDFTSMTEPSTDSDSRLCSAHGSVSDEIDACVDADVQEALKALEEL